MKYVYIVTYISTCVPFINKNICMSKSQFIRKTICTYVWMQEVNINNESVARHTKKHITFQELVYIRNNWIISIHILIFKYILLIMHVNSSYINSVVTMLTLKA